MGPVPVPASASGCSPAPNLHKRGNVDPWSGMDRFLGSKERQPHKTCLKGMILTYWSHLLGLTLLDVQGQGCGFCPAAAFRHSLTARFWTFSPDAIRLACVSLLSSTCHTCRARGGPLPETWMCVSTSSSTSLDHMSLAASNGDLDGVPTAICTMHTQMQMVKLSKRLR